MAVIVNAKMWSFVFQMVLLVQYHQIVAISVITKRAPYSVQEMSQEFSSESDIGSFSPWSQYSSSSDSGGGNYFSSQFGGSSGGSFGGSSGGSFGGSSGGSFGGSSGGSFGGSSGASFGGSSGGSFGGGSSSSFSGSSSGQFGGSSSGFYAPHLGSLSSFGMQDSSTGSFDSFKSFGKGISEDSQFLSSGGKSINELQEEAKTKLNNLILESKQNQRLAEAKIEKLRKSYGYGTFGFGGYQYPISNAPIDLGTHHGVDLGTTLDGKRIKDSKGKLKYPVQTVYITKTVGVPIPEPYPIKHEVPVPAPYPVPVPSHHYSSQSYPSSYSSDYSSGSGKTSYQNSGLSVNKIIRYHENLPKSTEKHYASASTNYVRYLPSRSSSSSSSSLSAYRTSLSPSHYSSAPKQSVYEFK